MAGAGYKLFNTGDVLTAAQVNTYLQEQVVMVFNDATARTTALSGVLAEGMVSYLKDTNATEVYDGSAWVGIGNSGDITGVTAGTGISGGGTSGTVTITNDMATTITAAGDIVVGTGSGTYDNLPIGTTGQVLTADTTVSPYKVKWATAAGGSQTYTLLNAGGTSLSGSSSVQINVSTKEEYYIIVIGASCGSRQDLRFRINADTGSNYTDSYFGIDLASTYSVNNFYASGATTRTSFYMTTMSTNASSLMYAAANVKAGNSTTLHPVEFTGGASAAGGTDQSLVSGFGIYSGSAAITSFTFFAGANFDAGTVYVYGA